MGLLLLLLSKNLMNSQMVKLSPSVKIFTLTMSSPVVPLCTQVLLIVCKRKSLLLPHLLWRSRSSPHQNVNTLSGLVVPSLLPSPPSKLCGSLNKNTMKQDHPLSTENAFKYWNLFWFLCATTTTPERFNGTAFVCVCISILSIVVKLNTPNK